MMPGPRPLRAPRSLRDGPHEARAIAEGLGVRQALAQDPARRDGAAAFRGGGGGGPAGSLRAGGWPALQVGWRHRVGKKPYSDMLRPAQGSLTGSLAGGAGWTAAPSSSLMGVWVLVGW
jgi:hypothetical protein